MRKCACLVLSVLPLLAQSNPELTRLYDEDQKERQNWQSMTQDQIDAMSRRDTVRRKRAAELLQSGAVKTGEDYEHAAFLFQHGAEPSDYLLAHILAMTAVGVESKRSPWLSTATLDRYLHSIGKPQIFGTQLDAGIPFDKSLVPDSVRKANCVPSVADQGRMVDAVAKKQPMPMVSPCSPQLDAILVKWSITERMPDGTFTQAVLNLSDADQTLTENGKKADVQKLTIGAREMRFQVDGREFHGAIEGELMSGTFTLTNGSTGRFVGLSSLPAKN
jgi:hypothetical protein